MAINDLLTQDEIDALLHGVSSGGLDPEYDDEWEEGIAIPYNFASQGRISRGRMPALELVNDRFAKFFSESLAELLNRNAEVSVVDVQMLKFTDYIPGLFTPASLNRLKLNPLAGSLLCVFDPKLVFIAVDNYFGGDGKTYTKLESRQFAPTEKRMIQMMLEKVMLDLGKAWQPILDVNVEYVNSDVNTCLVDVVNLSEQVVVSIFHAELEGCGGDIHVTIPYAMLKPIRDLFDAGLSCELMGFNEQFAVKLQQGLKDADVEITSHLAAAEISLRELNELKVGDVIPIEKPDTILLKVGGTPVFKGKLGVSNSKNAVKIHEKLNHEKATD